jgi:hypothetical protein
VSVQYCSGPNYLRRGAEFGRSADLPGTAGCVTIQASLAAAAAEQNLALDWHAACCESGALLADPGKV